MKTLSTEPPAVNRLVPFFKKGIDITGNIGGQETTASSLQSSPVENEDYLKAGMDVLNNYAARCIWILTTIQETPSDNAEEFSELRTKGGKLMAEIK